MKKTVIGILADVDAGKTTLSEAMLYIGGVLRKKGRVDHRDAFLDTHSLEKARGITIFSKQAIFTFGDTVFTLLDTPGHADFTAEAERTLQVLDMAVLIVSASDGVAGHTETLWKMLAARNIPTLIFVNKTDMAGFDRQAVTEDMHRRLSRNIVDFTAEDDTLLENLAMCDEILLDLYTENGTLSDGDISAAAARRTVFPCCFGSALKSDGVERLLDLLNRLSPYSHRFGEFAAQVYKIERDSSGKRMTCMKITGGTLKVRNIIRYTDSGGTVHEEKVSRIRIYNGGKFEEVDSAETGDVCAVMGLSMTFSGQGLGEQADSPSLQSEPVMTYRVLPPDGCDNFTLMSKLTELQEEDPQLHITYDERHDEIYVRLMGEIQTEILRSLVNERFGLDVTVDSGRILYRETVAEAVEGVGHFEPLKHYAEVHVVISPLEQGSGIIFESVVSEDRLDRNWQNLILGSLQSKTHIGVLTGSPITDVKITLTAGKAHVKHTEGGDFRQAAWRAVRQGLMKAESVLLEPFYSFTLTVPSEYAGRSLNDIQLMGGEFSQPQTVDGEITVSGKAPVSKMRGYGADVTAYTRGRGRFSCVICGYEPCRNAEEVISEVGYNPESDTENTADSVFCYHGSGQLVNWREVEQHMHLEPTLYRKGANEPVRKRNFSIDEDELERIMQKIAPKKERVPQEKRRRTEHETQKKQAIKPDTRSRLMIVDGYNVIFAWDSLRELAAVNIDSACDKLADILSNYAAFREIKLLLVFDAYRTPAVTPHSIAVDGIEVVYTKSGQTCDAFIESFCSENQKKFRMRVVTNDGMVQLSIMSLGALRMSVGELKSDVEDTERRIRKIIGGE